MRYEIRPLSGAPWLGPVTPPGQRIPARRFSAAWSDTLDLLDRETRRLGAKIVVLQVDVTAGDIRLDGMLYARARVDFPGVRVSFDSRFGPLTYATDTYTHWQANVRAVALALEALRAVDRYGVSKTGEQYRGWSAIEGAAPSVVMSLDEATTLLSVATEGRFSAQAILTDPEVLGRAYKAAARDAHPDRGGDRALFERLTAARDLIAAHQSNERGN